MPVSTTEELAAAVGSQHPAQGPFSPIDPAGWRKLDFGPGARLKPAPGATSNGNLPTGGRGGHLRPAVPERHPRVAGNP